MTTDRSGERYWTVVSEHAVETLEQYLDLSRQTMTDPLVQKIMQGYHEFVESGKREIYRSSRVSARIGAWLMSLTTPRSQD